jgi:hypothetical protein
MSAISSLSSAPSALSSLTAHSHGHKKGSKVESSDDSSSDGMTPVPAGTQQNLFSSLLQSLEQVIGIQPAAATAAPSASSAATTASPTVAAASTAGAGTVTSQSANAALQKYIHNVSQNPQASGSQLSKLAGSNVSVNA